jgi:hypothetical protein
VPESCWVNIKERMWQNNNAFIGPSIHKCLQGAEWMKRADEALEQRIWKVMLSGEIRPADESDGRQV